MKITPIQLAKRVEKWGQRLGQLGVAHYRIEKVHVGEQSPWSDRTDIKASVWYHEMYDSCEFYFNSNYLEDMDEQELDESIIHEWMHVAMRDFDVFLESVASWMPDATYTDFKEKLNHEREGVVDRTSRALYQLYSGKDARFALRK